MLDFASFHVGVTERTENNDGVIIERFQRAVDGHSAGEPYCMGFLQYCALETALVHGGTPRIARSESCLEVWEKTPLFCRVALPSPGDWVLWQVGNTRAGHAGIVREVGDRTILTVEANTSPGTMRIVREGEGVYIRERPITHLNTMRLLGFLRVFE